MHTQRLCLTPNRFPANSSPAQKRAMVANEIAQATENLARRSGLSFSINSNLLLESLDKYAALATNENDTWNIGIKAANQAPVATVNENQVNDFGIIAVQVNGLKYIKSSCTSTGPNNVPMHEISEGVYNHTNPRSTLQLAFGERIVDGNHRENGVFAAPTPFSRNQLTQGVRDLPTGIRETGLFKLSPHTGDMQLKQGRRVISDNEIHSGEIQIGRFSLMPQARMSHLEKGTRMTDHARQEGLFAADPATGILFLEQGSEHFSTGAYNVGEFEYFPQLGTSLIVEGRAKTEDHEELQGGFSYAIQPASNEAPPHIEVQHFENHMARHAPQA